MSSLAQFNFDEFFVQFPKYNRLEIKGNPIVKDLFEVLTIPENVRLMVEANDIANRPALFGVLSKVEALHNPDKNFDLTNVTIKQLVGSMVKFVLMDFGYENYKEMKFGKQKLEFFQGAMRFKVNPEKVKLKIVTETKIYTI